MSIEEQIEIVESNIAEYGVCDITIEEYRYLKQKIRADAIEDILYKLNKLTTYYLGDKEGKEITPKMIVKDEVVDILEQLKEQ